jgi:enoyl-[acyl-carrier-protein] reductase (NADH)
MISEMSNVPEVKKALEEVQPFHRLGQATEVANTVVFLCSDDANGISGAGLPVDAALTAQLKV